MQKTDIMNYISSLDDDQVDAILEANPGFSLDIANYKVANLQERKTDLMDQIANVDMQISELSNP